MATRYINPSADPGGDGTTNALTGGTCAFQSLSAAEAALGTGTLSEPYEWIVEGTAADTTVLTIAGPVTSSTNTITIKPSASYKHSGVWSNSIYRYSAAGSFRIDINNVIVEDMQIESTNSSSPYRLQGTFSNQIAKRCLIRTAATNNTIGVVSGSASANAGQLHNCLLWTRSTGAGKGIVDTSTSTGASYKLYNCTIIASNSGSTAFDMKIGGVNLVTVKNCIIYGFGTFLAGGGGALDTTNSSYNATDLATATGGSNDKVNQSFGTGGATTFVDPTNGDYRLLSTDTVAKDSGEDLTSLGVSGDIDGTTRSGTWDIGFDEVAASTTTYNTFISGRGRISTSNSQYIDGRSRIQQVLSLTIQGTSRVLKTGYAHIEGQARVQQTGSAQIQGTARILATASATISGQARIQSTASAVITGVSRIQNSGLVHISGVSRIAQTGSLTQTGVANIKATGELFISGRASILEAGSAISRIYISGVARIQATSTLVQTGVSRIQRSGELTINGTARIITPKSIFQSGISRIAATTTLQIQGTSRIGNTGSLSISGVASITNAQSAYISGTARIQTSSAIAITGKSSILKTLSLYQQGVAHIVKHQSVYINGLARIANTSSVTISGRASIVNPTERIHAIVLEFSLNGYRTSGTVKTHARTFIHY